MDVITNGFMFYIGYKEKWKYVHINNQKTKYKVSNFGRICNTKRNNAILSQILDKYGYCQVCLSHKGKKYVKTVHTIVASEFIPKDSIDLQVNHKDGKKYNNAVFNLEWITAKENIIHAYKNHLHDNVAKGDKHGLSIYKESDIHLACKLLETNLYTYSEITEITNIPRPTLHDIVKKDYWTHISDNYNVTNFNNCGRGLNGKLKDDIIKLVRENKTQREIRDILGLPYSDKLYSRIAYYIKKYNQ